MDSINVEKQSDTTNDEEAIQYYAELFPNVERVEDNPWLEHHEKFSKIWSSRRKGGTGQGPDPKVENSTSFFIFLTLP